MGAACETPLRFSFGSTLLYRANLACQAGQRDNFVTNHRAFAAFNFISRSS